MNTKLDRATKLTKIGIQQNLNIDETIISMYKTSAKRAFYVKQRRCYILQVTKLIVEG